MSMRRFVPVFLSVVVFSALLVLAACMQPGSGTGGSQPGEPGSDDSKLSYEDLQFQRWKYQFERRELGPSEDSARWALFDISGAEYVIRRKVMMRGVALGWENVGTNTSGRILSHAFDPLDSLIIWAGSASGGLWKTTDAGTSWMSMTQTLWVILVQSGLLDARIPPEQRRYGSGVLRSTDGGKTWQRTSLFEPAAPMDCNELVWDPVRPDTVYLAASNGVWMSADTGKNWRQILHGNVRSIVLNESAPDVLYAALFELVTAETDTAAAAGVWKTTDAGANWTRMTKGVFDIDSLSTGCGMCMHVSMSQAFPEVIFFSVQMNTGNVLYKTSNGGANWQRVEEAPNDMWKVHVSPVDTNIIFVGGVDLYRTQNGGADWQEVGNLFSPNPLYFYSLDADDSTQAWSIHVDQHDFGFRRYNPNIVYTFGDGGVFVSYDGGNLWTYKNNGLMTLQMYSLGNGEVNTDLFGAGTQDQGQLILQDYISLPMQTPIWRKWLTGDGMRVLFKGDDRIYASSQYGEPWTLSISHGVFTSPDTSAINSVTSGLPTLSYETSLWQPPMVMDPFNSRRLFMATYDSLYRTTWDEENTSDTALTWQAIAAINTVNVLGYDRVGPQLFYAYSAKEHAPALWRTLDGGQHWKPMVYTPPEAWPGSYVSDLEADPDIQGSLYAVRAGYKNQVWYSPDSARTWVNITHNLPGIPVSAIAITPDSTVSRKQIYLGTDAGVFMAYAKENPKHIRWRTVQGGLPSVIVSEILFHPGNRTLRVGTFGRGLWMAKVPHERLRR